MRENFQRFFSLVQASHCLHEKYKVQVPAANVIVFLGRFDIEDENEVGSLEADISDILVHPDWNPFDVSFNADIAVLTLKHQIIFTSLIQPVCLPDVDQDAFNVQGTVVGYGITEDSISHVSRQRHVELFSVDHQTCLFGDPRLTSIGSSK